MNNEEAQSLITKLEDNSLSTEELKAVDAILIGGTDGDGQAECIAALLSGLTLEQLVAGRE